ncbi:uncharacterized protein LOC132792529 [Drosophila nasuta]|uniref:uncharacterized protein LOC132792529 n=1 Tax=Drosophila nasuta TaxID=42062 RepID=UPI00295E3E1B|nr:uncharacterized protein LOC132792529 [Drosophila nasuta]
MSKIEIEAKVRTSDGKIFTLSPSIVEQIGLLRKMQQNVEDDEDNIIPLDRISSKVFQLIIKWCNEGLDLKNVNRLTVVDLIAAADFLEIPSLVDKATIHIAALLSSY